MRVVHVFRSPVGGLFRHVCDLVEAQQQRGFSVGIVCDQLAGGAYSDALIEKLQDKCALGIVRMAMPRMPSVLDFGNLSRVAEAVRVMRPDILHGHGSKGGLYARMAGRRLDLPSIYTPHGGVLNYEWASWSGPIFLGTEKLLAQAGSGFAFVCEYERDTFDRKIGTGGRPYIVAHNGLWQRDFMPISPNPNATDLIFAGEMRYNKGVDLLIEAVATLNRERPVSLTLAGDGPQIDEYKQLAAKLQLGERAKFIGRVPIQQAFAQGRIFVAPSRFESFPYVIMEAISAEMPIVSTNVGGIAEVLPDKMLTAVVDTDSLMVKIRETLDDESGARTAARALSEKARIEFTVDVMADKIISLYQLLISKR